MAPLRILSLDLDWFNPIETSELPAYLAYFFRRLRATCVLPKDIAVLTEHHYLYPWCARLLELLGARQVDLVNIDAHHDFYRLHEIKDFATGKIHAGNFLPFMAHAGLLHRYTWITNKEGLASKFSKRPELLDSLKCSPSPRVRGMKPRIAVWRMLDVWDVLREHTYDGFAIILSPGYTRTDLIPASVNRILKQEFSRHGYSIHRNRCAAEYKYTDAFLAKLAGLHGTNHGSSNGTGSIWAPASAAAPAGSRRSLEVLKPTGASHGEWVASPPA